MAPPPDPGIEAYFKKKARPQAPSVGAPDPGIEAYFKQKAQRGAAAPATGEEMIAPIAERLGVRPGRVLCNDLVYDDLGRVTGVDDATVDGAVGYTLTATTSSVSDTNYSGANARTATVAVTTRAA